MKPDKKTGENLRDFPWRISYRTSSLKPDGSPVDILHDFYIPVLQRSLRYDRVAGFFNSSSLAAASQGFSAFVGREGRARFVVGADLDLEDVRAILSGEEERLSRLLAGRLEDEFMWPENALNGVALLGWMVAEGHLDIKVAFRVHGSTGEVVALESVEDGYVHMKWAIFTDGDGNRIYISGSLNESRSALVLNAENIDVHCDWRGETEKMRVDEAQREFEALWEDRVPFFRVFTLPEAVRRRLIQIGESVSKLVEIDGSAAAVSVSPPSGLERLRFALLRDGPKLPGGRYVGMETVPITPWPHQTIVARRIISSWPASHLLCDEVGLGKTIEAGLAIRSLYLSGLVKRVLICAPAALTGQWQRELAYKFYLPFGLAVSGQPVRHSYLLPSEGTRAADSLYAPDLIIVSGKLLVREERREDLDKALPFDVTLIDEAHNVRRENPARGTRVHPKFGNYYKTVQTGIRNKTKSLLLATATPMQLDPVEVSDLLALTRRGGPFQFDSGLMAVFYEIVGNAVSGSQVSESEWDFLRKAVFSLKDLDPLHWEFIRSSVIDGRIRIAVNQWLKYGDLPRGKDLKQMLRVIFSASPLSRTMLRHTRKLLEVYQNRGKLEGMLAERKVLPLKAVQFTDQERTVYEQLEIYCKELAGRLAERAKGSTRSPIGYYLSFLRLRFASSLYAIRETIRRRIERVEATLQAQSGWQGEDMEDLPGLEETAEEGEDDRAVVGALLKGREVEDLLWERNHLKEMMRNLEDLAGQSSKMTELLRILDQRRIPGTERFRQTVIFTRFFDTLTDIVSRLQRVAPRMLIGTYSGQGGQYTDSETLCLTGTDRDAIKHRFLRGEIDVLICTDAASEGLNLQTADLLVNFDLPWNPMKVEQRIGRIDRIGQKNSTIYVINLCYVGSAEETVYGRLWQRLTQAGAVVGTQQISLLPVTFDEFEKLAEDPSFYEKLDKRAKERALLFQKQTAAREIPPEELFEIYSRMEREDGKVPVDLARIWETISQSTYLRELGCRVLDSERQVLRIENIDGVPSGSLLTTSRETFEVGLEDFEGNLHFATYGDPVFDALLDHMSSFALPKSIKRLVAHIPTLPAEMVGYAVAALDDDGGGKCRLVKTFEDIDDLRLDEAAVLTDDDTRRLLMELDRMAMEEFGNNLAIPRIEAENECAAVSQKVIDYLIIRGLILERRQIGKALPLFWREIEAIEDEYGKRENLRIRNIPGGYAKRLVSPLFALTVPSMGGDAYIDVPKPGIRAAIEAACRVADSMKVRRSELTTDQVLARLDRLVNQDLSLENPR